MEANSFGQITKLLRAWAAGDESAHSTLFDLVYQELHKIAKSRMGREAPGHTSQTTALVNEFWLRLMNESGVEWQNRNHFYSVASTAMRHILVDWARKRRAIKRGGGQKVAVEEAMELAQQERSPDLVALDDALIELEKIDARKLRVVELKFFGGLTTEEVAEVMGISDRTVKRDWELAKAILYKTLGDFSQ